MESFGFRLVFNGFEVKHGPKVCQMGISVGGSGGSSSSLGKVTRRGGFSALKRG